MLTVKLLSADTHTDVVSVQREPSLLQHWQRRFPGRITGLEIEHGAIAPVQWVDQGRARYVRQQLGPYQILR